MQFFTFINILCLAGSIAMLVLGIIYELVYLAVLGPVFYLVYPALTETLANLLTNCFFSVDSYKKEIQQKEAKMSDTEIYPFIYHERYNVTACGIEKLHPFDAQKYGRIFSHLRSKNIIKDLSKVWKPSKLNRKLHQLTGTSKWYLFALNYSLKITGVVEVPVCMLPASILRWRLLEPMDYATQGSIDGGLMALQKGWAFNLSGGYHHARSNGGGGFCVFPDITITIRHLRQFKPNEVKKVMIIDLDAHQGNGHERDFMGDEDIFIADVYNHGIYPGDNFAKKAIKRDISVYSRDSDEDYLLKISIIEKDVDAFKPDFIVYNAGTDIIEGDPLGNLQITPRGIIQRDELVFRWALRRNIPVLMVLSGGYQRSNAQVIADSIENVIKNESKLKSQTELRDLQPKK